MRIVLVGLLFASICTAKRLPDINWNSTSLVAEICAEIDDTMDINCPVFPKDDPDAEQSIIYRVSHEEYSECRVGETAREVGRCVSPHRETNLKVSFRRVHPNPFALEYRTDTTYYFISTSKGSADGLENKEGGLCSSKAMKLKIHVIQKGATCPHIHRHRHHHAVSHHEGSPPPPVVVPPRIVAPASAAHDQPLWEHFFDKIPSGSSLWSHREPTRGERIALDEGDGYKTAEMYDRDALTMQLGNEMEFQIHEIGEEPDSLPYSSSSRTSSLTILLILLSQFIMRLLP